MPACQIFTAALASLEIHGRVSNGHNLYIAFHRSHMNTSTHFMSFCHFCFPGINAQARKLQKTRSRGRSVVFSGGGHDIVTDIGLGLCRSLSEADLRPSPEPQQNLKSQLGGEDSEAYKELPCVAGRKEETENGDDNCTQYSIHPPVHFPYFLLLQGFSYRQVVQICPTSTTHSPPSALSNISSTVFCGIPGVEIFYICKQCIYFPRHPSLYQWTACSCLSMSKSCFCTSCKTNVSLMPFALAHLPSLLIGSMFRLTDYLTLWLWVGMGRVTSVCHGTIFYSITPSIPLEKNTKRS